MAIKKKAKQFLQMRQKQVPFEIHRKMLAHQKFMSLKSDHEVTLEEAAIDIWERGLKTLAYLNQ